MDGETTQANRHSPERAKPKRYADRWPDDGLPARFGEHGRDSLHPFAVLARTITGR